MYELNNIYTGIELLDKYNPLLKEDYMIISGSTGSGKSYLALWMAVNAANSGKRVLYIDMENPRFEVEYRLNSMGLYASDNLQILFEVEYDFPFSFNRIENTVSKFKPDLLIIDVFSCLIDDRQPLISTKQYSIAYSKYHSKFGCAVIVTEQLNKDVKTASRPNENFIFGGSTLTRKSTKILLMYDYLRANKDRALTNNVDLLNNTIEVELVKNRYMRRIDDQSPPKYTILYTKNGYRSLDQDEKMIYIEAVFKKKKNE